MSDNGEWVEVAAVSDLEGTDRKVVDLGENKQYLVFKLDDGYFAVSMWCSHQKMSLQAGDIMDDQIMCPLHGALFDIRTGENKTLPAVRPIDTYEVKTEGEKIMLKV